MSVCLRTCPEQKYLDSNPFYFPPIVTLISCSVDFIYFHTLSWVSLLSVVLSVFYMSKEKNDLVVLTLVLYKLTELMRLPVVCSY